jgi:hypothetical protein
MVIFKGYHLRGTRRWNEGV